MIFVCDKCHFIFSRTQEPEQCPDCGKYAVRRATEAEKREYKNRLKEPMEQEESPETLDQTMSIVMNLYYTGMNGSARKFAEEMERIGTADLIRKESGNLRYEYFLPMDDPETVLLIDAWADQQSLDLHHASPMMETIAQLREKYDLHMRAERYRSDEQGVPVTDSKFIRQ